MDCIIPAHNIKIFSSAISSLSRVGKELLVEFSPQDGLTLRSLNDGKSAFASYKFDPSFFERCIGTGSSGHISSRRGSSGRLFGEDNDDRKDRYLCRVLLKTIAAVLKPRRGLDSLRLRSLSESSSVLRGDDKDDASPTSIAGSTIQSVAKSTVEADRSQTMAMQLIFEFRCEPGGLRISHRIGVAELETSVSAVAPRNNCSEIVAAPKALMKLIDPLKGTIEVALNVNCERKTVILSSFHHADATLSSVDVSLLGTAAVLKTQTSMACDDFDDFLWRNDRSIGDDEIDIPNGVNEEVILVFGIKEVKVSRQVHDKFTLLNR